MSRRSWIVRSGGLVIVIAGLIGPGWGTGASAARAMPPPDLSACAGPVSRSAEPGAWWTRQPVLDDAGSLAGWTLEFGLAGEAPRTTGLPAEAAVSGPEGGLLVVSESDDRRSRVRLVATSTGCADTILETPAIVRTAVLHPSRDEVFAHLLRRSDRADLGVWRLPSLDAGRLEPLAGPARDEPLVAALGPIWATELAFDATGSRLAIQSCAIDGCATRVVDLATGAVTVAAGSDQGDLVALVGDRLVTWAACDGVPCPVIAIDIRSGRRTVLEPVAVAAAPIAGASTWIAVATGDGPSLRTRLVDASGTAAGPPPTTPDGLRPIDVGARASSGVEAPVGWLAVDRAGREPQAIPPFVLPAAGEVDR
jgi:hypothetical protein